MVKPFLHSLVLFLLSALLAGTAFSQGAQSGAIAGTVSDPSGAVIGGATVSILNDATKSVERTVTSTGNGLFSASLLPPGDYTVNVTKPGFKKYAEKVQVLLNQTSRVDAKLEVGTTSDIVEVQGNAGMVNTESAVTGQPINSATMTQLPLPVPNFMFLLSLSAGTAGEFPDVRAANRGVVDINVNGQRTSNNSVTLEGINVNDFNLAHFDTIPLPAPHAIEEFNVATSLYDASSGDKGGGAVGLMFKTGSKDWHGEAYWQHRNDWLNANEWFTNNLNKRRQKFLQNVLGFSGSGPMPLLGGFWFANVHGLRSRNGVNPNGSSTTVTSPSFPTAADGSTSAALLATGPFGLTAAQIDPTALAILNDKNSLYGGTFLVPRAGQPGCAVSGANTKCVFNGVSPESDNQYSIVYDRPFFNGKSKVSGRWFWDNFNAQLPFGTASTLAFPEGLVQNNRFATISDTHEISNRQLNVFRVGFSRFVASFVPTDKVNLTDVNATRPNASSVPGIYQVTITGGFSLGTGVNDDRGTVSNTYDYSDTWSIVLGKHTLKVGGGATRYQLNRFNRFAIRGSLGFNNFNDFLTGTIDTLQAATGNPQRYYRATDFDSFVQDDYKVLSNLTLNLGLRWDSFENSHDLFLRTTTFDPSLVPGSNPFLFPSGSFLAGVKGTPGVGDCGARTCRSSLNFGPRVGFSWDPFRDHKTVVRGGYGIYTQRLSNQNFLQGSLGPPFFVQIAQNLPGTTMANPLIGQPAGSVVATAFIPQNSHFVGISGTGDPNVAANIPLFQNDVGQYCQGFAPASVPLAQQATNCSINLASFSSVSPKPKTPYNQQWNLGLQHDLGKQWILEIGYVGSHYLHGLGIFNPIEAQLASPTSPITVTDAGGVAHTITVNTVNNEPLRVTALGLSRRKGARTDGNIGFARYNSGQFSVTHRFDRGLYFQAAYTWAKEIDNVSGSQSTDELNATQAGQNGANLYNFGNVNPALNSSIGDFDRRHRFVFSYVYDLPVPKSGIWGTQAFQGWSISGINTYQDGLPFSVTDANGGRAFGGGTSTGMFLCSSIASAYTPGSPQSQINNPGGQVGYLNPACFGQTPVVASALPLTGNTAPTGFGNVPRNAFRGPFQSDWDFGLAKTFKITERQSFDIRADFFNVLNHPVFKQPAFVGITSPTTFGFINQTVVPARLIQLNLQYSF
jgi:hypothetical protein